MALFDNFKEKVTDLAQSGAAKTKQLAEIAKLKTSNMAEADTIKKAYVELGKLYYAEKGSAPDAAYAALCEKITASKANIEANKARIEELKNDGMPVDACETADFSVADEQKEENDCGCGCDSGAEAESDADQKE